MARRIFAGLDFQSHPNVPYLWMKLPEPWLSGTFKQVAANEGVLIDDEDEYKPGRGESVYYRVRVGFSIPKSPRGRRGGLLNDPSPDRSCRLGIRQLRLTGHRMRCWPQLSAAPPCKPCELLCNFPDYEGVNPHRLLYEPATPIRRGRLSR